MRLGPYFKVLHQVQENTCLPSTSWLTWKQSKFACLRICLHEALLMEGILALLACRELDTKNAAAEDMRAVAMEEGAPVRLVKYNSLLPLILNWDVHTLKSSSMLFCSIRGQVALSSDLQVWVIDFFAWTCVHEINLIRGKPVIRTHFFSCMCVLVSSSLIWLDRESGTMS